MDRALDGAQYDAVERVPPKPPAPATRRRARGRSLARAVPLVAFLDDRPRLKHFYARLPRRRVRAMAAIAIDEVQADGGGARRRAAARARRETTRED